MWTTLPFTLMLWRLGMLFLHQYNTYIPYRAERWAQNSSRAPRNETYNSLFCNPLMGLCT